MSSLGQNKPRTAFVRSFVTCSIRNSDIWFERRRHKRWNRLGGRLAGLLWAALGWVGVGRSVGRSVSGRIYVPAPLPAAASMARALPPPSLRSFVLSYYGDFWHFGAISSVINPF